MNIKMKKNLPSTNKSFIWYLYRNNLAYDVDGFSCDWSSCTLFSSCRLLFSTLGCPLTHINFIFIYILLKRAASHAFNEIYQSQFHTHHFSSIHAYWYVIITSTFLSFNKASMKLKYLVLSFLGFAKCIRTNSSD